MASFIVKDVEGEGGMRESKSAHAGEMSLARNLEREQRRLDCVCEEQSGGLHIVPQLPTTDRKREHV